MLENMDMDLLQGRLMSTIPWIKKKGKRERFTNEERMNFVREVESLVTHECSPRDACDKLGKPDFVFAYYRWRSLFHRIRKKTRFNAKSIATGRPSVLKPYEGVLLRFITKSKKNEKLVTSNLVLRKAHSISSEFRGKTRRAQQLIIQRFLAGVGKNYDICCDEVEANIGTHDDAITIGKDFGEEKVWSQEPLGTVINGNISGSIETIGQEDCNPEKESRCEKQCYTSFGESPRYELGRNEKGRIGGLNLLVNAVVGVDSGEEYVSEKHEMNENNDSGNKDSKGIINNGEIERHGTDDIGKATSSSAALSTNGVDGVVPCDEKLDFNIHLVSYLPDENYETKDSIWSLFFTANGFHVIDVKGDGHCGFYCVILGLCEMGLWIPGCKKKGATLTSPSKSFVWFLRKYTRDFLEQNFEYFVKEIEAVLDFGAPSEKEVELVLRNTLFRKGRTKKDIAMTKYLKRDLTGCNRTNEWFCGEVHGFVIAAAFRIRLVIYGVFIDNNDVTTLMSVYDGRSNGASTSNAMDKSVPPGYVVYERKEGPGMKLEEREQLNDMNFFRNKLPKVDNGNDERTVQLVMANDAGVGHYQYLRHEERYS
jgi:hypothetical protein